MPPKPPTQLRIVSVNVGLPRDVVWHGHTVTTGIFKRPVQGPVTLHKLNLDGDRQADLTVHGGEHKAVYCYPLEHYNDWKKKLPNRDLSPGSFGENFTTEGLLEDEVHIGDRFAITKPQAPTGSAGILAGSEDFVKPANPSKPSRRPANDPANSAQVIVTQPRLPCYKLGIRFQADDMVNKFLASRRTGFYLAVTREGQVSAGDEITVFSRDPNAISIADFLRLYLAKQWTPADITQIHALFELPSVPDDWKSHFSHRLHDSRP